MDWFQILLNCFPELSQQQIRQFELLTELYPEWNDKINVISRKDIENLIPNHILHSLVIAKFLGPLAPGTTFLDLGTGGGFPGLPLAIVYPDCRFHLIDRIAKKIKVAEDIAQRASIRNVTFQHGDSGECHASFNYVVSRAVMPLNLLVKAAVKNISSSSIAQNSYRNGIIALKGGDLAPESQGIKYPIIEFPVKEIIPVDNFDTKLLVYIPIEKI